MHALFSYFPPPLIDKTLRIQPQRFVHTSLYHMLFLRSYLSLVALPLCSDFSFTPTNDKWQSLYHSRKCHTILSSLILFWHIHVFLGSSIIVSSFEANAVADLSSRKHITSLPLAYYFSHVTERTYLSCSWAWASGVRRRYPHVAAFGVVHSLQRHFRVHSTMPIFFYIPPPPPPRHFASLDGSFNVSFDVSLTGSYDVSCSIIHFSHRWCINVRFVHFMSYPFDVSLPDSPRCSFCASSTGVVIPYYFAVHFATFIWCSHSMSKCFFLHLLF